MTKYSISEDAIREIYDSTYRKSTEKYGSKLEIMEKELEERNISLIGYEKSALYCDYLMYSLERKKNEGS